MSERTLLSSLGYRILVFSAVLCLNVPAALAQSRVDRSLRRLLTRHGIETPDAGGGHTEARIKLGQMLFFDRELSGNRDTSCATCHHPQLATGDALSLPVGTAPLNPGALGPERIKGEDREFVPRNAPEIFNRGSLLWTTMFWDSRIAESGAITPAGDQLLDGLTSALYAQAMFPVTSRDEMRGRAGDVTIDGEVNEVALVEDGDLHGIWSTLMERLGAITEYRELFEDAYPGRSFDEMTFADAANAIGAFEIAAFTHLDTPFDRYLQGDSAALGSRAKRGALLFFGKANCVACHSGPLLTDQQHHSLGVPQLGPGKEDSAPLDLGRFLINDDWADVFAFRTPPLRNVADTFPYMHNGAFRDLRSVLRHHSMPELSLLTYRAERQLDQPELIPTVLRDWFTRMLLIFSIDRSELPGYLSSRELDDLEAFLRSLSAPDLTQRLELTIPEAVPSGLPVERR